MTFSPSDIFSHIEFTNNKLSADRVLAAVSYSLSELCIILTEYLHQIIEKIYIYKLSRIFTITTVAYFNNIFNIERETSLTQCCCAVLLPFTTNTPTLLCVFIHITWQGILKRGEICNLKKNAKKGTVRPTDLDSLLS